MAEAVAVAISPTVVTGLTNVDPDPDATQLVAEPACMQRKEDDTTKDMMEGAAQKAVKEVNALNRTLGPLGEVCCKRCCGRLAVELHGRMTTWESKMQHQWEVCVKKRETNRHGQTNGLTEWRERTK